MNEEERNLDEVVTVFLKAVTPSFNTKTDSLAEIQTRCSSPLTYVTVAISRLVTELKTSVTPLVSLHLICTEQ
jgi:hypothetical protein